MSKKKPSAQAYIEKGDIVIRLPIKHLSSAVEGYVEMDYDNQPMIVLDEKVFAKDVVNALNDEDEEGTSPIHQLFDRAFEHALEDGSIGVAEAIRCEECEEVVSKDLIQSTEDYENVCDKCHDQLQDDEE